MSNKCEMCKINDVEIWNDCGNLCLKCWQRKTEPNITVSI
jgi:hypothetical protein